MKISKVVITCFKKDFHLARLCVASIRYWYPDVEIYLLKDEKRGTFSTREVEENFNVRILQTPGKYYGWGTKKFEVLFTGLDRFLLLDADTVFIGKVLDDLSQYDDDFIVTGIVSGISVPGVKNEPQWLVSRDYIDVDKITQIDPEYKFPGYGFNSGQMVVTTGKISESFLDQFLLFPGGQLKTIYRDALRYTDQGLLNYILAKICQQGKASVRYHEFWLWPELPKAQEITVADLRRREVSPLVLHWAGIKSIDPRKYARYDILTFYGDYYYSQVPFGFIKRHIRDSIATFVVYLKIVKHTIFREKYM